MERFSQFKFALRLHSWHGIFQFLKKILEKPTRIYEKIPMSISLLNLLVEFPKVLPNFEFQ
jgi:hypothetical protein